MRIIRLQSASGDEMRFAADDGEPLTIVASTALYERLRASAPVGYSTPEDMQDHALGELERLAAGRPVELVDGTRTVILADGS